MTLFDQSPQWALVPMEEYVKIYIKTAPTCFGVTFIPSSLPNSATYRHQ